MFNAKEPVSLDLRSRVVYKFSCAGCNACYIGETSRHLLMRVREHLSRDRNSHVYQHLQQSQACRCLANKQCFSIVDCAPKKLQLMLKEAMHIKWENSTFNKQLKHADWTLSFWYYSLCIYTYLVPVYFIFFVHNICVIIIVISSSLYNFLPCIKKCSARASVIPRLALLKIVRSFFRNVELYHVLLIRHCLYWFNRTRARIHNWRWSLNDWNMFLQQLLLISQSDWLICRCR